MKITKRLGESAFVAGQIAWWTARYIRLVALTARWSVEGVEPAVELWREGKPFIGVFWHGRMLLMPGLWRRFAGRTPIHMLISQHRDGRIIARTIASLGVGTIAGSSTRGGTSALREIVKTLERGAYVGITPDGPRGPLMRMSMGAVSAAQRAGVPIIVISNSASRRRIWKNNWDRFVIPLPFARIAFVIRGPVVVPKSADAAALERIRRTVEDLLNEATRATDQACGWEPIEPAPERGPAARKVAARGS